MKWVKANERLPETKGTYITRRPTLDRKQFIVKDVPFNPKYDDTYIHNWINFEIEWLDETQAPIPTDIKTWIGQEADKYGEKWDYPITVSNHFYDGATALYQLVSKELEEKEQEIQRLQEKLNEANKLIKSLDYGL